MSGARRAKGRTKHAVRKVVLDAESNALMRLVEAEKHPDVERAARQILSRRPTHHLALKALSFALISQDRCEEALPVLEFALTRFDVDPELHNNVGIVLSHLMRWDESLASFRRALELHPNEPEVLKNLGVALVRMHRWNDAVPVLLQAIEHHPDDYPEAIQLLADALASANRVDEAWVCYNELWLDDQRNTYALYQLQSVSLRNCKWEGFFERLEELRRRDPTEVAAAGPFGALGFPGLTSLEQLAYAKVFARNNFPASVLAASSYQLCENTHGFPRRLKVGFMSADYRQHAVGYVIPQVVELLDRERVEVFGYSIGEDDKSDIRTRIVGAFDQFADLKPLGHRASAQRIQADQLDILVDLQGWTAYQRAEVLALRCAPIQVGWLGYPGTIGHPRLADYLLGDPTVTPLGHADFYTETLAQLPNCYLPADATRSLQAPPTRAEAGLPESGFVFCSFNNSYKFNPQTFDVWCRILLQCPGSILWLSSPSPTAKANLEREAATRGIDPARVVFAPRTETQAQHLARLQLADLALDTFPYNSHSTGIDTLWAGVPMVTCMGETFASRVGASALRAVNLPELVTTSLDQYQELILELYRDQGRLRVLRQHLNADKSALPLFDMKAFAKAMVDVFVRMSQDQTRGKKDPILSSPTRLAS
jgi:predicted O-linked N-acetylglucosamine transferase (SPINDLY family)